MCRLNQSIKKLSYSYDLVSGNVNEVIYQKGETDEFRHKYNYDADNRITNVFTSKDGVIYEQDAKYFYYDHGPLARTEIGHSKVQAMDYAYTIQGWIKSVNGEEIDEETMMGWDGAQAANSQVASTINKHVAKDAFGFTLNYFEGDYRAIGTNKFEAHYSNTPFGNASANLYNGNIRHMVTAIEGMEIQGYAYAYDQLQRLNTMKVFRSEYLIEDNDWRGAKLTDDYFTRINYDKNGNILTLQRNGYKGAQLEMDRFEYFYETIGGNPSNRLNGVKDSAPNYAGYDDIKDGSGYKYNRLGELVYDDTEAMKLEWRYGDHKLKNIERLDQNSPDVEFIYNPLGVRVAKIIKPRSGGVVLEGEKWKVTYYSYDANGQLMATYNSDLYNGTIKETKLEEQYIYGSKRVGVIKANKVLYDEGPVQASISPIKDNFLGKKRYELTNHLGNVLATISDRKIYNSTDGYYEPVITMKADYYAFGMLMPNRFEGIDESRHLFNGMEHDMEISGEGNSYTTEFRQYDPRLGRWKSLDPLMSMFPWQSPYVAFDNNPIFYTDPLGLAAEGGDGDPPSKNDDSASEKGDTFIGDDGKEYALTSSGGGKTVTRKDRALAKIDKFEKEESISDFENISKSQLISDMRDLVNNPKNTQQCPNTCGISAVQYNLLNDAPHKFVDFVTNTYTSGDKPQVLNENLDRAVSVDYNDFNELEAEGNSASWIFQATLRNTYNAFWDYDPRESANDQIGGITTPNEVIAMMMSFGYDHRRELIHSKVNSNVIKYRTILLYDTKIGYGTSVKWHYVNVIKFYSDGPIVTGAFIFDTQGIRNINLRGPVHSNRVKSVLYFNYND